MRKGRVVVIASVAAGLACAAFAALGTYDLKGSIATAGGEWSVPEDGTLTGTVADASGKLRNYGVRRRPSHGVLTIDSATGDFVYKPAPDFNGVDEAVYYHRKGKGRGRAATIRFIVQPVNDAPTMSLEADSGNSPETLETSLPLGLRDVDGDPLQVSATAADPGVASVLVDLASGTLRVTSREQGATAIEVTASDGRETARASTRFVVGPVTKRRDWSVEAPVTRAISISNLAEREIEFDWVHSGNVVYTDRSAMVADVGAKPADLRAPAPEFKLWRYVSENTFHWYPVTEAPWIHDPMVLVNSIGFGFCDDVANATAVLARLLGFQSRVWWLSGHVVPEVQVGGTWKVLDPDLAVFYRDASGDAAGIDEIVADPGLVTRPQDPVLPPDDRAYGHEVADIYATSHDNRVEDYHLEGPVPLAGRIALPAGARLTYPGKWSADPVGVESGRQYPVPMHAQLRLDLPAGFVGTVRLPFVLWDSAGDGQLMLDGVAHAAGSAQLRSRLQSWQSLPGAVEVSAGSGVTLVYLVNPIRLGMATATSLQLTTVDAWALQVELVELARANRLPQVSMKALRRP